MTAYFKCRWYRTGNIGELVVTIPVFWWNRYQYVFRSPHFYWLTNNCFNKRVRSHILCWYEVKYSYPTHPSEFELIRNSAEIISKIYIYIQNIQNISKCTVYKKKRSSGLANGATCIMANEPSWKYVLPTRELCILYSMFRFRGFTIGSSRTIKESNSFIWDKNYQIYSRI